MEKNELKDELHLLTLRVQCLEDLLKSHTLNLKTTRTNFQPPTAEQVAEYFLERVQYACSEDALNFADVFISHYTNTGWKYGKNKMKDWKAAMRSAWDLSKFVTKNNNQNEQLGRVQRSELQRWLNE